jgi:hypothetical protein
MLAMAIHSAASCVLTPAIAAISIGLVGHARAGERLGRNASFSAIGNALGAAGMGAIGYYLSNNAVFYLAGLLVIRRWCRCRSFRRPAPRRRPGPVPPPESRSCGRPAASRCS